MSADLNQSSWLEAELLRQMAQVKAPDTLWKRIQSEQRSRQMPSRAGWVLWPAVATILLLASGDLLWQIGKARGDVIRLSDREISRLASENPAEIRAWVRTNADMDIDLACGQSRGIELSGVRLLRVRGELVAAISYQSQGKPATLLVSKKGLEFRRMEPQAPDSRLVSWSSRDRSYAIAWQHASDVEASCMSCHVESHGQL
jgi:hypothetical protein